MYRKSSMRLKGISDFIYRESISASQTFLFSHRKSLNNLYVMNERVRKEKKTIIFPYFIWLNQKETLGLLNHRRNKYIKQRSHHSIFFLTRKRKVRVVIGIYRFGSDRSYFSISSMKGKNSIVEPYAMCKRCLYGCSILSFFLVILFSSPHHAR